MSLVHLFLYRPLSVVLFITFLSRSISIAKVEHEDVDKYDDPSSVSSYNNIVKPLAGMKGLEKIMQALMEPAVMKIDPIGCIEPCAYMDKYWELLGTDLSTKIFQSSHSSYYDLKMYRLNCNDHPDACTSLGTPKLNSPLFGAWTNLDGDWSLTSYTGPLSLDSLTEWVEQIFTYSDSLEAEEDGADMSFERPNFGILSNDKDERMNQLGMSPLSSAAFEGDVDTMGKILDMAPSYVAQMSKTENKITMSQILETKNANGATALMLASQTGHVDAVRLLLEEGADPHAMDRFDATSLLMASFMGRIEVVKLLLNWKMEYSKGSKDNDGRTYGRITVRDATMGNSFLLSELAMKEGHDDVAALLLEFEAKEIAESEELGSKNVEGDSASVRNGDKNEESLLPSGMEFHECIRDVRLDEASCKIAGCNLSSSSRPKFFNANDFDCDGGTPCPYAPLGKLITIFAETMSKTDFPTWHIRSPKVLNRQGHHKDGMTVPWWKVCGNNAEQKTYDNVVAESDDVWQCLFGRAEHVPIPENCSCDNDVSENDESHSSPIPNRDVAIAIGGAIILHGERTSPYLSMGSTLPPFDTIKDNDDEGITVSVHVRAGDSCDVVIKKSNSTSWLAWPFNPNMPKATDWSKTRRYCVHPTVHASAVRSLWRHHNPPVKRVLLATDSQDAVDLFESEAIDMNIELVVNRYDREQFEHPSSSSSFEASGGNRKPLTQDQYWIEYRSQNNATFAMQSMLTAVEDLRLLARGTILIGAMCGKFAQAAHLLMIAHNKKEVKVVSVDRCKPICSDDLVGFTNH